MRRVLIFLLATTAVLAAAVAIAGAVFLEDEPRLAEMPPPTPDDVRTTRDIVHKVRGASGGSGNDISLHVADLNSAMRMGTRFLRGLRTEATIENGLVHGAASLPVPWPTGRKWLNVEATVPPFESLIAFDTVRVAGIDLPPDLARSLGRLGANLVFDLGTGDKIIESAAAMEIVGEVMVFTLNLSDDDRGEVITGVFGALRGSEMPSTEEIDRYYVMIREAMDAGTLSNQDSFLPHIRFTLETALDGATPESLPNDYTAAIFGLTKACGAQDFTLVVGRLAGDSLDNFGSYATDCTEVTFNDRIDSRRHFITAAAIKAASNRGFAISVGEFKELHDTISGAGGFDFTDIVANNSGIRMSDLLMTTPPDGWPAILARMQEENDVIAPYDGVPGLMPEQEFQARFGDVEDPRYYEMLAKIEAKIDRVPIHAE